MTTLCDGTYPRSFGFASRSRTKPRGSLKEGISQMRHARGLTLVAAVLMMLTLAAPSASAQDPIHKMGRGLGNVLTCWIELPKNFHKGAQEQNPVLGIGWGLVKGSGLALTRLALGGYETVSFFVPYPKEYASPYEGLELPDYAWE